MFISLLNEMEIIVNLYDMQPLNWLNWSSLFTSLNSEMFAFGFIFITSFLLQCGKILKGHCNKLAFHFYMFRGS